MEDTSNTFYESHIYSESQVENTWVIVLWYYTLVYFGIFIFHLNAIQIMHVLHLNFICKKKNM